MYVQDESGKLTKMKDSKCPIDEKDPDNIVSPMREKQWGDEQIRRPGVEHNGIIKSDERGQAADEYDDYLNQSASSEEEVVTKPSKSGRSKSTEPKNRRSVKFRT